MVLSSQDTITISAKELKGIENEHRKTPAQILAGVFVLVGLYFGWRRIKVSEEAQITERFTRAIDQLGAVDENTGNPKIEICLGGYMRFSV